MTQEKIDNLIYEKIKDPKGISDPIYDGIINELEYNQAKYKILWVLKESHDEENDGEGGWSFREHFSNVKDYSGIKEKRSTLYPIVYISNGILNDLEYGDMNEIKEDSELINILRKIAYINVKKIPGKTKSNNTELKEAYNKYKDILFLQINTYNPDIIIFAGTFDLFSNDLKLEDGYCEGDGNVEYIIQNKKLYINAYHPSQTQITNEEYFQGIIYSFEEWKKRNN